MTPPPPYVAPRSLSTVITELQESARDCDKMAIYHDERGSPHHYPEHAALLREAAERLERLRYHTECRCSWCGS